MMRLERLQHDKEMIIQQVVLLDYQYCRDR